MKYDLPDSSMFVAALKLILVRFMDCSAAVDVAAISDLDEIVVVGGICSYKTASHGDVELA